MSLDGGGVWSLIQVKALKAIFGDVKGLEVLGHFDLVVANSGGSLVAAGLAEDYSLSDIEHLFLDREIRSKVFAPIGFWQRDWVTRLTRLFNIGPKYSAEAKYRGLQLLLPTLSQMPLTAVPARVPGPRRPHFLIVAFDYYRNRARFFRSNMGSAAKSYNLLHKRRGNVKRLPEPATFVQAVHAATNAPVNYFDKPAQLTFHIGDREVRRHYWDGAIGGYNNPVLAAVVEAISNGIAPADLHVLSIGTGIKYLPKQDVFSTAYEELVIRFDKPDFTKDLIKMTSAILGDPPDAASFMSYTILEPQLPARSSRFVRISPVIQPRLTVLDGVPTWDVPAEFSFPEFNRLLHLDMDAVRDEDVALIDRLAGYWLSGDMLNQPIRNDKYLRCLLGHNTFSEALDDLKTWILD